MIDVRVNRIFGTGMVDPVLKELFDNMLGYIKKTYFHMISGAAVFLLISIVLEPLGILDSTYVAPRTVSLVVMLLIVLLGIILPMWYKILMVRQIKGESSMSIEEFTSFERKFLYLALSALYVVPFAFIFRLPKWPMLVTLLVGFYSAYYYFPSKRRMSLEKRIFRIREKTDESQ